MYNWLLPLLVHALSIHSHMLGSTRYWRCTNYNAVASTSHLHRLGMKLWSCLWRWGWWWRKNHHCCSCLHTLPTQWWRPHTCKEQQSILVIQPCSDTTSSPKCTSTYNYVSEPTCYMHGETAMTPCTWHIQKHTKKAVNCVQIKTHRFRCSTDSCLSRGKL